MKGSEINPMELFAEGNPEVSTKKRIVFEDPKGCKSKYVARNPDEKKVCEILIDGGLLKDNKKKCDYGLWVEYNNRMILIELKGRHVEDAYEQLIQTYGIFRKRFAKESFCYSLRMVVSENKAPRLNERIKQEQRKGLDITVGSRVLKISNSVLHLLSYSVH